MTFTLILNINAMNNLVLGILVILSFASCTSSKMDGIIKERNKHFVLVNTSSTEKFEFTVKFKNTFIDNDIICKGEKDCKDYTSLIKLNPGEEKELEITDLLCWKTTPEIVGQLLIK